MFSHVPPNPVYPSPLKGICFLSRAQIHQVIHILSSYKAPGPDNIPNVVLIKCCDVIIGHVFFIFGAIIKLNVHHPQWLELTTLVLRKIGKLSYDVAKAYCPIGLINTIPKVFSTHCSKHISYLAKKHGLLPPSQFGGRPRKNTTDVMLLVTHKIKNAWRKGQSAAALFLNLQGVFSNTIKEQLIHNMCMRRVLECFINIISLLLTGHTTHLKFDNYISEPIPLDLDNSTMQRDPSSMLYYSFYNAPLIKTHPTMYFLWDSWMTP